MSVRLSVCQPRLGENAIFSAPIGDVAPTFFLQIPFINEHLFWKYFACLSVMLQSFATYGCFHPCFLILTVLKILPSVYPLPPFRSYFWLHPPFVFSNHFYNPPPPFLVIFLFSSSFPFPIILVSQFKKKLCI